MSKRVLKKDPCLPLQIWDGYHPPSTLLPWDNSFVVCRWGGARTGCRPLSLLQQKNDEFMSRLAMAAALRGGATAMMVAQGRASWTEGGWWRLTAVVDNEGGGSSMAAGEVNGGNNGRLQSGGEAAGAKRKTQTQQSNEEGGSIWTPSNAFRCAKRRWRGVCRMSVMAPWQGYRGAALSGQRWWCIRGVQVAAHCCWRGVGGAFRCADC